MEEVIPILTKKKMRINVKGLIIFSLICSGFFLFIGDDVYKNFTIIIALHPLQNRSQSNPHQLSL
jgi:hypothetical protein